MDADPRRNAFKARNQFKPEEVRRRRETAQVEIRKQKKAENLAKRRNFNATNLTQDSDDELDVTTLDSQVRMVKVEMKHQAHVFFSS
jgi:oligoendopeptidase F